MILLNTTRGGLLDYITAQLNNFYPDHVGDTRELVSGSLDDALDRLEPCVRLNRVWPAGGFNYLHSNQYATFLYFLSNSLWRSTANDNICSKIFYLNKALNGLECFYSIALPEIFSICHSPGIVLAQATYANYLVLYQGSTVGRVDVDRRPVFEEGVVLFPGSAVIGDCRVGAGTIVSHGTAVIDANTPGNCIVFRSAGQLLFKSPKRQYVSNFFRLGDDG